MANDIYSLIYAQFAQLFASGFGFCRGNELKVCLLKEQQKTEKGDK